MLGGSVLWFRHGLRLHDNPSLHAALEDRSVPFFPVFIFDGETAGTKVVGYNRMRYLLEALDDLDSQFKKFGGRLIMVKGKPKEVFRRLWEEFGIRKLCFEQDCEPVWRARDDSVKTACRETGVTVREHVSHTLWEPDTVIRANGGIPPLTYQMFLHTVATIGDPPRPVIDIDWHGVKFGTLPDCFKEEFTVFDKAPKPEDFGIFLENDDIRMIRWVGGETTALKQMQQRLAVEYETFCRGSYLPTHASPDLLGPPISLSPALRFGSLSVRKFYWGLQDLFTQVYQDRLNSSHFITGQLIWREYFYTMSVNNPNYGQMANNPICLDIPWKTPEGDELQRWKEGRTGFPFIDAAMRQLRTEGWLHHAVRNTVASFLTRGTLWLSWEHGLNHFLKYLLDADWSVCAGNWMWVSSSAFEVLLDSGECACPVRLGQRLNPSGEYVRRYVPELARMPQDYIYEPWKAPLEVQQRAECIIGKHYPGPLVNHLVAGTRNRSAMKVTLDTTQTAHTSFRAGHEPWKAPLEVQQRAECVIGKHYPGPLVNHLVAGTRNRSAMKVTLDTTQTAHTSFRAGYEPWKAPLEVQLRAECVIGKHYPGPLVNHLVAGTRNRSAMKVTLDTTQTEHTSFRAGYEPWKAPLEVQQRAECIIGKHYPGPLVNHLVAGTRNRNAMKELRHILHKAPPHCCPSSEDEIRQFMWLNEEPQVASVTVN